MVQIEYAFLADAADAPLGGKLYALGIGIDEIQTQKVPTLVAHMVLVVKFKLNQTECDRDHRVEIQLNNEDGKAIGPVVSRTFNRPRHPLFPTSDVFHQIVMNMHGLTLSRAGAYQFNVSVNGEHRKSVPLRVVVRETGNAPNA